MKKFLIKAVLIGICLVQSSVFAQNYALDFDGVNDKIGVTDSVSINPTSALTVEAWINADTWKSSIWAGTIIGKQAGSPDRGYCLTVGEGGKAEFTVSIADAWEGATTPAVMGLNTWYHIVGVYDGSSIKVYINGVLQATTAATGALSQSTGTALFIGENPTWTGRYFDGTIDEVRIWNIARNATEILNNMTAEISATETGLVAYYKMNENSGTAVNDATSNANNGIMLNMDAATDWVPGFVAATSDIGVVGIARPSFIGSGFTTSEQISVEVKNYATTTISTFEVSYELNGNTAVTETVNASIPPFGTYIYTFSGSENLSGQSSCTIKAYTSLAADVNYSNDTISETISQSLQYALFDGVQHNFGSAGQTKNKIFYMPDSLDNYSQILLRVSLRCPPGGCDPWDQAARINLVKDGEVWELARYITPYGIACGNWVFDITDFRSLLVNKVNFESYIQVWGASGWLLDATLELTPGTPTYKHVKVQKLWNNERLVYGDPGISYDLSDTLIFIHPNTSAAKIRLTTTGHGQGNTNNAAEFFNATHKITVNGADAFTQNLWKSDCNTNSCSNQNGTWQYARAGWCPGQDVQPSFYDLQGLYTPGQSVSLDYVLQDYTNLLNTGYNNSGHTEPFLRIHGYLITYGNSSLVSVFENLKQGIDVNVYPNPAHDRIFVYVKTKNAGTTYLELFDAMGKRIILQPEKHRNNEWCAEMNIQNVPSGIYFLKANTTKGVVVKKVIIK